jgi:poly(3-hydroxybutyrate) depolymerase
MDADYYLETIETVFQEYKLVNGTWDVRSPDGAIERVRPQDIKTTALFTVEGELDDISGSGQTEAAHDLCTGIVRKEQRHLQAKGAGHYGIFSGRRWRDVVYPQVRAFILEHEMPQKKAAAPVLDTPDDNPPRQAPAKPIGAVKSTPARAAAGKGVAKPAGKPATTPTAKAAPATSPAVATRWVTPPASAAAASDVPAKVKAAPTTPPTRRSAARKA